jgi:hypothetical protein
MVLRAINMALKPARPVTMETAVATAAEVVFVVMVSFSGGVAVEGKRRANEGLECRDGVERVGRASVGANRVDACRAMRL